jgi:phenylalanyl-tRNA synthetase beta chain
MGATGSAGTPVVHQSAQPLSFFDLKGDVESLLSAFQYNELHYDAQTADYYHPGRSARAVMDGFTVAQFGQIHPDAAARRKLRQDVFIAELSLDVLYRKGLREIRYRALPRYPAVARDFSFVFADSVGFANIHHTIATLGLGQLRSFVPAEVFRGGSVPAGRYSLLLRATFQSNERTLREDEVAQWSGQITRALEALGGTQRA